MRFGFDNEAIEKFEEIILAYWRNMIDVDTYLTQMERQMGAYETEVVMKALDLHINDTRTNSRGEPMGKYPPEPADLRSHASGIEKDRKDRKKRKEMVEEKRRYEEDRKRKAGESDEPYKRFMGMQSIQDQVMWSRQVRTSLQHAYPNLDPTEHSILVMEVLKRLCLEGPLTEHSARQGLRIAVELWAEGNQE